MLRVETKSTSNIQSGIFQDHGLALDIPVELLWPTQPTDQYRQTSIRFIKRHLSEFGIDFIRKNPVNAVILPYTDSTVIAINDGHHRARFAPMYGIRKIPCLVVGIGTISRAMNIDEESERQRFEEQLNSAFTTMPLRRQIDTIGWRIPTSISDPTVLSIWLSQNQTHSKYFFIRKEQYVPDNTSDKKQEQLIARLISSMQGREKSDDLKDETLKELSSYGDGRSLTKFVAQLEISNLSPRRPFVEKFLRH